MTVPCIVTPNSITVLIEGRSYIVNSGHPNFALVSKAVKEKRWADVPALTDIPRAISVASGGRCVVQHGVVYYDGLEAHNVVVDRIYMFMEQGQDITPLLRFFERLMMNPSNRAVNELYSFLEHKNLPVDEDGYFYAYKAVKEDYYDKYSGKYRNRPGDVLVMPRNRVNDDANHHCADGFHAGSIDYVKGFGNGSTDRIVIVKIDPSDVVSIPNDCSCQKLRTCKYEVVSDYTGVLPETVYAPNEEDDYYFDGYLDEEDNDD